MAKRVVLIGGRNTTPEVIKAIRDLVENIDTLPDEKRMADYLIVKGEEDLERLKENRRKLDEE